MGGQGVVRAAKIRLDTEFGALRTRLAKSLARIFRGLLTETHSLLECVIPERHGFVQMELSQSGIFVL